MTAVNRQVAPDFRNLGTIIRCVVLAEAVHFAYLFFSRGSLVQAIARMGENGAAFESTLLLTLLALFLLAPRLRAMPSHTGRSAHGLRW